MGYRVAYDITNDPPFDMAAAYIAGAFILAGIIWRQVQRIKDKKRIDPSQRKGITTPKILIVFGSLFAVIGIGLMGWDT